jgi:hypothetical protein
MMEKRIEICIGTDRSTNVRARLSLLIVSGGLVASEHYHSVLITPKCDLAEVRSRVEKHLAQGQEVNSVPFAPWPAIPDAEWAKVERVCEAFHPQRLEAGAEPDAVVVQDDHAL